MKVLVTGGSGLIGSNLSHALLGKGHEVVVVDLFPPRFEHPRLSFENVNLLEEPISQAALAGVGAVVHLAGKSIFGKWNEDIKRQMYDSRVVSSKNLIAALDKLQEKPKVFIAASGVGYYGDKGEEEITESSPPGEDFLAKLCVDWERETGKATEHGMRTVVVRIATVLGPGGALGTLVPMYKWGIGGPLAGGNQWWSWVHVDDLVGIMLFALEHDNISGPIDTSAPQKVRQKEFAKTLGQVLNRPAIIPTPEFVLRLMFGEFADTITASQKVSSQKIQSSGFIFKHPELKEALEDVLEVK